MSKQKSEASETEAKLPLKSSHSNAAHALKTTRTSQKGEVTSCYSPIDGFRNSKTVAIGNEANAKLNSGACTQCGFDEELHDLGVALAEAGATEFTPSKTGSGGIWS